MGAMNKAELTRITRGFKGFVEVAGFGAIRTEADYDRALAIVEAIMDATRGKPERENAKHPMNALLDLLTPAIEEYEARVHPVAAMPPGEILRGLMKEHGLRQSDLPEIGNQSVVSQILAGKRQLNARQIGALAKRFKMTADAFLP
ncbi:helix-turn-helix domain-containing protein [Solimonas terrae]|uniref:helix-turn-helix domain-containing protein n=1 Tax=Solimonas terrae TaxID=1396819 RepID=UPI001581D0A6|nr:transcriptional regulator [Solimonas terrae]